MSSIKKVVRVDGNIIKKTDAMVKEASPETLRLARKRKWEDLIPTSSELQNIGDVVSLVAAMHVPERLALLKLSTESLDRYGKANAMVEFGFGGRVFTAPAFMCKTVIDDIQALKQHAALANQKLDAIKKENT